MKPHRAPETEISVNVIEYKNSSCIVLCETIIPYCCTNKIQFNVAQLAVTSSLTSSASRPIAKHALKQPDFKGPTGSAPFYFSIF